MISNIQFRHNLVRFLVILIVGIPTVLMFFPFVVPLLLAVFFAFGLEPIWDRIGSARRQKKLFPLYLVCFCFFFLIVPFVFVAIKLVRMLQGFSSEGTKNSQFFQSLTGLWDKFTTSSSYFLNGFHLGQDLLPSQDEMIAKISPMIVEKTTALLGGVPEYAMALAVFLGALILLVSRTKQIKSFFIQVDVMPETEMTSIIASMKKNCYQVLISIFFIGMLQAVIVAIGATVFGFHEFFLIFIVTFLVSFIPVIGAAPVAVVLSLSAFLMGQTGNGIGLLVVATIAGSIDNIIKPFVFSSKDEGVHPFLMLLGIIGAILVFGLPGLLLGPLLLQVGAEVLPQLMNKFIKNI